MEQLSRNNNLSIVYNDEPDNPNRPYEVNAHATIVTSIIAGQTVSVGSRRYEGGASAATVYQMPTVSFADALRGMWLLK